MRYVLCTLILLMCLAFVGCSSGISFASQQKAQEPKTSQLLKLAIKQNKKQLQAVIDKTKKDLEIGHKVQQAILKLDPKSDQDYVALGKTVQEIVNPSTQDAQKRRQLTWAITIALALIALFMPYLACKLKKL